jgi:RNA polymerase sigma-70 factor, ECF subfamily
VTEPLVQRAQAGDPEALEELLTQLAPSVHRFGVRMCRDLHDAEDVVQDTLLGVATHLGEFQGRSSLKSWVFALTRSACARKRRGLKNQPPDPLDDEQHHDAEPGPEANAAKRELAEALAQALERLPEEYREVLLLRDVEGLTAPEAADALEVSIAALKSRLHRARAALRDAVGPLLDVPREEPGPSCPDAVALISRRIEGELTAEDCATMEAHVRACPGCGSACAELEKVLGACRQAAERPVPPELESQVKRAVASWLSRQDAG